MKSFVPEGLRIQTKENREALVSPASLKEAAAARTVLEARALLCDKEHNLFVDLGCMRGRIPRVEGALGIEEGTVRDIALISRVNKPVCFYVVGFEQDETGHTVALLSRRAVQKDCMEQYIDHLQNGDVIDARVTHLEKFGAFVDIGAGVNALVPIDMISISRIPHPAERFCENEDIRVVVKSREDGKITLSHRELLGTWEENARLFSPGETVPGIIRSVESYGVFVELTPNLAGLAEPAENVKAGQRASVYIKSILPERMKLKLVIVNAFSAQYPKESSRYFYEGEHMDYWRYSPMECEKQMETFFEK